MKIEFVTVDVFTDRQFGGNPLAVVPDGRGLAAAQMQAIAAEFNLSETTFVLPPREAGHTAQVRIFTPRTEIPFAGHPNVGTAFVLGRAALGVAATGITSAAAATSGDTLVFEETAGLVNVDLIRAGGQVVGARLTPPRAFALGVEIEPEIVAAACGLAADDIDGEGHRPCVASCGMPFVFARLRSRAALAAARPHAEVFASHLGAELASGLFLYLRTAGDSEIEARMFAPMHGIVEDPATGSAGVALIGLLAHLHGGADLTLATTIRQGEDMGRPSRMQASAEKRGGKVAATFIGGTCVPVMRGTIDLA
jgi:trans-2,3-dihydro-3-hydroxyanthranilate isomerase